MTQPSRKELLARDIEQLRKFTYDGNGGDQARQAIDRLEAAIHAGSAQALPTATPQEVQEACAQVADRAAERFGDALARKIAKSIRALIPPAALPASSGEVREGNPDSANENRVAEDSALIANVRAATIEECAKVCDPWIASKNLHERLAAMDIKAAILKSSPSVAVQPVGETK